MKNQETIEVYSILFDGKDTGQIIQETNFKNALKALKAEMFGYFERKESPEITLRFKHTVNI